MRRPAVLAFTALAATGLACRSRSRAPGDAAAPCLGGLSGAGDATHYDAQAGAAARTGSCSFEAIPDERMVAALNGPDYDHAAWCGACLAVRGPDGDIVVRVVDKCPGCEHGDLDLGREAFAQLAPLSAGRVRITWRAIECPVTGPIAYRFKSGSNAQWSAIQVRNHRHAIARLEARGATSPTSAYRTLARTDYNYFVAAGGLGTGPYAVRVTDVHGHVVEDSAIALDDAVTQPGSAQLASCP